MQDYDDDAPQGWVALHRRLCRHPRFRDPQWLSVWLWLLLHATHKPWRVIFCGKEITLLPGQLITGRHKLSQETGIHESKVRRVLKILQNDQQIDLQAGNKNTLITIRNWATYQYPDRQNDQQQTGNVPSPAQPMTTNNNGNNENTGKQIEKFNSLAASNESTGGQERRQRKPVPNENELLEKLLCQFTNVDRENWGGQWRNRLRDAPRKFERLLGWIEEDQRDGKAINSVGGYANDLWEKRLAD